MSELAVRPLAWMPPSMTLMVGNISWGKYVNDEETNLKPSWRNCSAVSWNEPGGVRWTIWSRVRVDGDVISGRMLPSTLPRHLGNHTVTVWHGQ
jgi:hypothetical protein